jgi:hypothetical protein
VDLIPGQRPAPSLARAERTVYDAISGVAKDVIRPTELEYLHIAPSGRDLVGGDQLVAQAGRERRLDRALATRGAYEVI